MHLDSRELAAAVPTSVLALALDVCVLHTLVAFCGWHYLPAATLSFTAGVVLAYGLSVRFVFQHRRLTSKATEFAAFALVGIAGLVINAAVIAFAVEILGQHYLTGKGLAAGTTFLFNFAVRRRLLFTPSANTGDQRTRA